MKRHTFMFWCNVHLWVWMLTCALPWTVCCVPISARPAFCALVLCCSPCAGLPVLLCAGSSSPKYGLVADRYHFCEKCFNEIQGDSVTLGDDPAQPQTYVSADAQKALRFCIFLSLKMSRACVKVQCRIYFVRLSAAWYQRSSLRRRKMTCWTLSRKSWHFNDRRIVCILKHMYANTVKVCRF